MNNLSKESVLNTLTKIFQQNIETELGPGLEVNAREAFIFSAITGSVYLENEIYPFSPKGLLKIFSSALNYKLVTGIFEDGHIKYSPHEMIKIRPYLNKGKKVLIPLEIKNEKDFRIKLKKTLSKKKDNSNFVIMKIDKSKKGRGLESYLEYLASDLFSKMGYVTETQVPLSFSLGSPDFLAGKFKKIQNNKFVNNCLGPGFNVIELSMIRDFIFDDIKKKKKNIEPIKGIIIGDAKTAESSMKKQIEKYFSSGFFNNTLEIHHDKKILENKNSSLMTIEDFNPKLYINENNRNEYPIKQKEYIDWFHKYSVLYLISNLSNVELSMLNKKLINDSQISQKNLITLVNNFDLKFITEELSNFFKV